MIFTQLIKANLSTNFLGREIEYYQRLESTNEESFELIEEGCGEGTIIVTDHQTSGKGRQGRSWFSAPGKGLAFSIILIPETPLNQSGLLSLAAGIAVAQAIEQFGLEPTLKWPNDILLNRKKCGGILVESKVQSDVMVNAVIGIGINVNESSSDFGDEIQEMATSIAIEKANSVQRELVLAWTLNSFEEWYNNLKNGDLNKIVETWLNYCGHLDKPVTIHQHGEEKTGNFIGVNESGNGLIDFAGQILSISAEEIHLSN